MKNIISFKKEVIFKNNIEEISSISLEHNLIIDNDVLKGNFFINGEYVIDDNKGTLEPFNLELPFESVMDEKYNTKNATIDIDDFFYEVINNNVLSISIDVLVDKLGEKEIPIVSEIIEDRCIEEETPNEVELVEKKEEIVNKNILNSFLDNSDEYVTYNVYVFRDGDTLESVMDKYNIGEEKLREYNDVNNINIGDKIIIPNVDERDK